MTELTSNDLTQDEKDILEELMNIAFGSASADLSEVINMRIALNVPEIMVLDMKSVPAQLTAMIEDRADTDIIEQNFWGDFSGRSFLAISSGEGSYIASLADISPPEDIQLYNPEHRHTGVFLEIGNIMIGACIGKISELLATVVTYSPPTMVSQDKDVASLLTNFADPSMKAIIIKTVFSFDEQAINGFLLTITNPESISWLKEALNNFMENYA